MTLIFADVNEFTEETRQAPPANLLVKIESFSLLTKHNIDNYKSRAFEAGGYKWKLTICPNNGDGEADDYVDTCISMSKTKSLPVNWEVNAFFTIFLYNHISNHYLCFPVKPCRFNAFNSIWGSSKMICKKMLMDPNNGYLVRDNCVIGAEVFVITNQPVMDRLSLLDDVVPYKREWKIPDISNLGIVGTYLEFHTGDHQWKISIDLYPTCNPCDDRYMPVYLELVKPANQSVNAEYCFTIKNNLHANSHHSKDCSAWIKPDAPLGFEKFIEKAELYDSSKGFVVDGCFVLEIKISVLAIKDHYGSAN